MEKAYDIKELGKKFASKGLPIAEEAALQAYEAVGEWLKESAALTATPIDDVVVSVVDMFDAKIKAAINKIDGQEG